MICQRVTGWSSPLLQELEQSVTILSSVSFKGLLGCKRLLFYFDG